MTDSVDFGVESSLSGLMATVSVRGELDLATKPLLLRELRAQIAEGAMAAVIDVSGLSFVDSAGVGALLEARKLYGSLTLRNPTGRVRKLLELVLIESVIPIEYSPGLGDEPGEGVGEGLGEGLGDEDPSPN